ncbi:MAG: hypothetical protein FJZ01_13920 [Candidatus Sericytochromatia bacterium]|nr:hypothetical protein [Candidatus Tanganyikabacteria bacterium]
MSASTRELPASLSASAITREIVEAFVRDMEPIRPELGKTLADSDTDDLYAPIWPRFGSAEVAALVRAVAVAVENNNRRLLSVVAQRG